MNYAVIESGGKQYVVSEGDLVTLDKLKDKEGSKIVFEKVLLARNGETVLVGTPYIKNASVSGSLKKHYQGEKINIFKFKAKVRYRRRMGFRPKLSDVEIKKINLPQKSRSSAPKMREKNS